MLTGMPRNSCQKTIICLDCGYLWLSNVCHTHVATYSINTIVSLVSRIYIGQKIMNQCTYASSNTALSPPHIEHIFFYDPSTVLCGYLWLPTVEMMMAVGYIV